MVQKKSDAGFCAIVRAHYSTEDGVAFAYEGFKYWLDWENYLENIEDEKGLAKFMNTGSILLKSQGHDWRKVKKHYDAVGVKYEEWDNEAILKQVPVLDLHEYWPVRRPENASFWEEPVKMLKGALFCPEGGYVNDPTLSAHNIMRAAEAKGATFKDVALSPTITIGYMWSPEYMGEEGAYNKYSAKLGLSLVYGFGLEIEAAHVDVEGGALTGNGGGMNGGDGYDWEYYRFGLSRDLIAGFSADASYYINSEEDYFKEYYGGKSTADPRLVLTLSRTF
jgi:hypothetical protein